MLEDEFDYLNRCLRYLCWEEEKVPYLRIVKEFSEDIGFALDENITSHIDDLEETVSAFNTLIDQYHHIPCKLNLLLIHQPELHELEVLIKLLLRSLELREKVRIKTTWIE